MKVRDLIWQLTNAPLDAEVFLLLEEFDGVYESDISEALYDPEVNNVFIKEAKDDSADRPASVSEEA